MASMQCTKPVEQPCNQGHQKHSIGQTLSEMAGKVFKKDDCHHKTTAHHATSGGTVKTETHSSTHTQPYGSHTGHVSKPHTHCAGKTTTSHSHSGTKGTATTCHGKKQRSAKKKGLLEKLKNKFDSDSDSGSSSESDNEGEKCGRKKQK